MKISEAKTSQVNSGVSILEHEGSSPSKPIETQLVYLDSFLIDRVRLAVGLSLKQLAVEAEISYRTLCSIFNRDGVLPSNAHLLAEALGKERAGSARAV